MTIPRPPTPSKRPVLPILPIPDSDDIFASQPPLCTPVDQLIVKRDNAMPPSPPSPVRTTVKRRRTSTLNVMSAGRLFDNPFNATRGFENKLSQSRLNNLPRSAAPHQPNSFSLANDDESSRPNAQLSSSQLPEMSQDTLALFPKIVQDHHMMIRPFDINLDSQQSLDAFLSHQPAARRHSDPTAGLLARASLYNTLSSASSMANPFLYPVTPPAKQPPVATPHSDNMFAIRKVANASESFQNMEPLLQKDDYFPVGVLNHIHASTGGGTVAKFKTPDSKEEKMKKLKILLVSSTQARKLRIDFELVRVAGKGAFSDVLEVKHRLDGCTYAVKRNKTPLLGDRARLEYMQEIFALSALQGHPNILRYHDAWFEDKGRVLMMQTEFLPGGSLFSRYIEQGRVMPLQELFALAADISSALAFMHSKGIAHLDVKPDNIFRCNRGLTRDSFIIGDLGLACHHDATDARSTEGDSRYLCPEALSGPSQQDGESSSEEDKTSDEKPSSTTGKRATRKRRGPSSNAFDLRPRDMFSLGATLYELASGKPLAKSGPEWIHIRSNTKKAAKEIGAKYGSAELSHVLKICLEPNPRYRASASEVTEICKLQEKPETSKYIERLRKELEAAQKQCKRFDRATSLLLKNGERNRKAFREKCAKRSKMPLSRTTGLPIEHNGL